ncbi:MAG TPA: hypothetical protein VJS30_13530, partial [Paraburkholderia sp.]|nr:hypothetical protein [Paraburkholderia sp.]
MPDIIRLRVAVSTTSTMMARLLRFARAGSQAGAAAGRALAGDAQGGAAAASGVSCAASAVSAASFCVLL